MSRSKNDNQSPIELEEFLVEKGILSIAQAQKLSTGGDKSRAALYDLLISVDEQIIGPALAQFYNVGFISYELLSIEPQAFTILPEEFLIRNKVFPATIDSFKKRIELLMLEPDNVKVLDEVALLTGFRAIPKVTTPKTLFALLNKCNQYKISADAALSLAQEVHQPLGSSSVSLLENELAADEAPVVQLVNAVLFESVSQGASDIHLESQRDGLVIRFRIDGILNDIRTIPKNLASAVISRIKISSGMDISERRRPQDGRIQLRIGDVQVDMRVNTLAAQHGESVVLRLLHEKATTTKFQQLGLEADELKRLMRLLQNANGIVLVTGPTGSGKTTTLYACLQEINSRARKIITIEDPIEYSLQGIVQTQVSHKSGLDFAVSLRAIMRQDPDVILLGEIRDKETLEAAMHAASTGHLVFSTLHTNSAAKTISRLKEMGTPEYLISSTIAGIVAQRLVRRICDDCKTGYQASVEELRVLGFQHFDHPITLYKGLGCKHCKNTGYSGRVAIYEILDITKEVQELIDANASMGSILDEAIQKGMITLGMDGERKIAAGLTTVEEVTRVLGPDW